jgi:phosphomannomutase/phosphoglucomutase
MKFNSEVFREYDIRGLASGDLTPDFVKTLGRAFGTVLREKGESKAVVGRDNRVSSVRIRENLIDGLTSAGIDVIDVGEVITPIFYYSRELFNINGGVMITGSHNPPEFNGFKIALGPSTIYGEQIQDLRRVMEKGDFASGKGKVELRSPVEDYYLMLKDKIKLARPLKVVVDCGNGTASDFAPKAIEGFGCEVIPLYCESDPSFPNHHPDPVKLDNLTELIKTVKETKADLGVAYDGDGDRIGAVDEKGNVIWGDQLMILYWREILPKHPKTPVIIEVKCSQALVDEVKKLGGNYLFYKTGHSLIKAKMKELGAVFTGEMSGHIFFKDEFYGFDDAIYATGRLLRILAEGEKTFSEHLSDVPKYYSTTETRINCPDKDKFRIVDELTTKFKEKYEVIDIDGARVLFPDGWGLIRCSNTQPVIVARCEAKSKEGLQEITSALSKAIKEYPEVAPFEWEHA